MPPLVQPLAPLVATPHGSSHLHGPKLCTHFYDTICGVKGNITDPTGTVLSDFEGETKTFNLIGEITAQNPTFNADQIEKLLVQKIYTPKRRKRIQGAFDWARARLERFIDKQPGSTFSNLEKRALRSKIHAVKLELPTDDISYADEPDLITKSGIYYERLTDGSTRIRLGGAYVLTASSFFNIVFSMAHELAHSIDPCEVKNTGLKLSAYNRIGACFVSTGLVASSAGRTECGENDQLSETYADWLAAQVTGAALHRFATEFEPAQIRNALTNSVRDLCDQDDSYEVDKELHPSPQIRIEAIFGRNPEIQKLTGCSEFPKKPGRTLASSSTYCNFDWEIIHAQPTP